MCEGFNLGKLAQTVNSDNKLFLDLLFSAMTHKPDCPLRAIRLFLRTKHGRSALQSFCRLILI